MLLPSTSCAPKRILIIRLDRIGDVVLSTPVITALRQAYPHAFISMMVRPVCAELVQGHPHLDDVILYDKDARYRGVFATVVFALKLRARRFDTAIVLHPTRRSHWIVWLAGIPRRIGYDRKSAWLLTRRVTHRKQEGLKHEAEYALEMLRPLGIECAGVPCPTLAVSASAAARVEQLLRARGVSSSRLIAIHPSASDASKRWLPERFARVADRLIDQQQAQVVLVAGAEHHEDARAVEQAMQRPALNLAGQLSIGELAAVCQRCDLLLSNDSGPVHVAAAVGTPVVAIFGRNQPGINATRWRPLGSQHVVLEQPGTPRFSYIEEWTVEEVYAAALQCLAGSRAARATEAGG